jgi:hypothetical protein
VWTRVCWRWWVGGGMDVVIRFACGHVVGRGACPWRFSLGVRLRGGLLVGVRFVGVVVMGGLGCDLLVLLDACVILRLPVLCSVSGDELSPVASLSGVGSVGRLCLVLYVLSGWWFKPVVVRWIC